MNDDNIIFEGHIFRDSASRLIIPEDIYIALENTKSTTSYEFAMQMSKEDAKTAGNYNYYASWFILVKHDGGLKKCINAAKVKGAKDSEAINKMIEEGKIVLSQVKINSAEEVFESKLKTNKPLNQQDSHEEYQAYIDKETKSIQSELDNIRTNIAIKSESEYNDLRYRLIELKDKNYFVYSKALGLSYGNESLTKDAETRYNVLIAKIDAVNGKLELNHDEYTGKGIRKDKSYYTFSAEKYPTLTETRLKDIVNDIRNYSENDYVRIKTEFRDLYNDIYAIYQLALNAATEMDCMTKILLDEAIGIYKAVVETIGKHEAELERLHNKNKLYFGTLIKKPNSNKDNQ